MTVFQVVAGWDYEGSRTLGIYTARHTAIEAADNAFAKQDACNDPCYDYARVYEITLDKECTVYNTPIYSYSKD